MSSSYNEQRFPMIQEIKKDNGLVTKEERYQYQYPIIMRYLKNKIEGWNIGEFIASLSTEKYVIYAITEFTELVCDDIANYTMDIKPLYVCDRNWMKYANGYKDYKVNGIIKLVDDYKEKRVEKILLCNIFHQHEIINELQDKGVSIEDIITVSSAIFSELL